jgi:hypothetical protein
VCAASTTAHAQFSGTVTGVVNTFDPRNDPYVAAGYDNSENPNGGSARLTNRFDNRLIRVRNVLVQVCVSLAFTPCRLLWTRTNTAGEYSVPWSGLLPPTSIRVRVYSQQPNIAVGAVVDSSSLPEATFRVTTAGIANIILREQTVTTNLTGVRTINMPVVDQEEATAAFLTARELYDVFPGQSVPPGGSILSDMQNVDIFVNDFGGPFDGGGGVAPTASEVLLVPSAAQLVPFTVAHELGHIVAWRALDIGLPPYEFSAYSACGIDGGIAWTDFSIECEKPAFWEGFAHVVGGFWMWKPTVQPIDFGLCGTAGHGIPRGGSANCTSLESPLQRPGFVGGVDACGAGAPGHQRAMCNTRGLWDLVDRPDGLDRDLGELVRVLRSYPRVCIVPFDNRCVNEFGYDGMNWRDYRTNHIGQFPSDTAATNAAGASNNLLGSNDG